MNQYCKFAWKFPTARIPKQFYAFLNLNFYYDFFKIGTEA